MDAKSGKKKEKKCRKRIQSCAPPYPLPWLPEVDDPESPLVYAAAESERWPPLLQERAWTASVPMRDYYHYCKPSEGIGSSYTPAAHPLRLPALVEKPEPVDKGGPISPGGSLRWPTLRNKAQEEEANAKEAEIRRQAAIAPGIVCLRELLDGSYEKRKKREQNKSGNKKKKFSEKKELEEQLRKEEEKKLELLEADQPMDPEEQIELMKAIASTEVVTFTWGQIKRINYYMQYGMDSSQLAKFPVRYYNTAIKKISPKLLLTEKSHELLLECKDELIKDFDYVMRFAVLNYILTDKSEQKRLKIPGKPPRYEPVFLCRPPVPWSTPMKLASHRIREKMFITHPVIIRLIKLWRENYEHLMILDWDRLGEDHPLPMYAELLEQKVEQLCGEVRTILIDDWIPNCADIFLELRSTWEHLVPWYHSGSLDNIETFFRTVNSLMSHQLRQLINKSIQKAVLEFEKYKQSNEFKVYKDMMFIRRPLITIKAHGGGHNGFVCLKPTLLDLCKIAERIFIRIIDVNKNIPRIECILFPEFRDNMKYVHAVDENEEQISRLISRASDTMDLNLLGPSCYIIPEYTKYIYILQGQLNAERIAFFKMDPFPYLKDFAKLIEKYETLVEGLRLLRQEIPLNLINLDVSEVNAFLISTILDVRQAVVDYFVMENRNKCREICDTFDSMSDRAGIATETTKEIVMLGNFLAECRDVTMYNLREQIRAVTEKVLFLMNHAHLVIEDIQLNARVFLWPKDMEAVLELSATRLGHRREQCEASLKTRRAAFEQKLEKHKKELDAFRRKDPPILNMDEMVESTEQCEKIVKKLQDDKEEAEGINEEEGLLDYDPSAFAILYIMLNCVDPFDRLWHTVLSFHEKYDVWYHGPFKELNSDEIRDETDTMWRVLYKLSKSFQDAPGARRVADMGRAKVEKFRTFVPVLESICNPGMKDRHWVLVSEALGSEIKPTEDTSLGDMVNAGLPRILERLDEISNAASKEHGLIKQLSKMRDEWAEIYFECVPYRDTGCTILSALEDIQTLLDDHILKAQAMKGSPYIKALGSVASDWEEKLVGMQDILDGWLLCQATWMYLEPIFSSEDIMRQMPTEARNFKQVDANWRALMKATTEKPHVLTATDYPNLMNMLKTNNIMLDGIQKGLNDYLEKKRLFFPRFFFLSNDELLEILSETKDPMRVQPHLKKCFEGINLLIFTEDMEVEGMISAECESVPFVEKIIPADAKGMVERWLAQVEVQMIASLKDVMEKAVLAYSPDDRPEWVLHWPGQIVQCGDCIHWTAEVTESIQSITLKEFTEQLDQQISEIVILVQGTLSLNHQITVEALIVLDVHARDVTRLLYNSNVESVDDFQFISQFRYYWSDKTKLVECKMVTTTIMYGFEYLGNFGRLVATPLTDRCFRTLMGALKLTLGGAPEGPAGTGKTETCKDLAKAVAKKCVVFNCSDGLDYKALGKFFKGLAQAGAWACFDEFNRIDLEVLSVVAQQILCIQRAIAAGLKRFVFEGTELSLDPTCTSFITMNPGYAGRQELPDNLKVLFRTVAMMVPDYAMIGEITLYSNGFVQAHSLAQKIVHTYKLCSEQLSSQNHYDYGMRAVKSVLVAAGALRRSYPHLLESELVLRAIIDVNLPKFLQQDVALFEGIYSDLFPGVILPEPDREDLDVCLNKILEIRNLQNTPWYHMKILQVYEMILVRHGLMVVGDPLGGKTCAYQSLAMALKEVQLMDYKARLKEFQVVYRILNPKAVTMGQLYGSFDPISHEWSDGVLANTFREYAVSMTTDRKWVLFDGPVDAVWIENMNTVLDDNKKLCLMSGEIIQMTNKMNLIFEPADLEQASPATVSRCGMIYLEPHNLGWVPLKDSFNNILRSKLIPEQFEITNELMDWLVPASLKFVVNAKRFVTTSPMHLFTSFKRLFSCLLEGEAQVATIWLQCAILFSIIWGIGSTLTGESRILFDEYFRKLMAGQNDKFPRAGAFKLAKNQVFPDRDIMFAFVLTKSGSWVPWLEGTTINIPANAKSSELMVPTSESICSRYFVQMLINQKIPLVLVGPTGTGKSAVVQDYLLSLPKELFLPNVINFSARTSANATQELVMSKLDRRRKGVFGPSMGKQCVLFVDDLGMPMREVYGAQPPLELLRTFLDHGHWSDLTDTTRIDLIDILFAAAMGVPGGSNFVDGRLLRHLHVISIDSFDDPTLARIFVAIMDWHFSKGFPEGVARFAKQVVAATTEVYRAATAQFLPTPAKCHYSFSLRDFDRVIKGILQVPSSRMPDGDKLIRLWVHESYRVFHDRLIDEGDRQTMFGIINGATYGNYRQHLSKVAADLLGEGEDKIEDRHIRDLLFGNYMNPDADIKIYDEVTDLDDMFNKMVYYLGEYNALSSAPMNLVLFRFALEHVSRVSRVLQVPQGHMLLVGIGGSGRKSAVKLAASIAESIQFQIEISRNYGMSEWRDDMKRLLLKAGIEGKPTVFLFNDMQVKDEMFVEDINALLNTGDLPNLYASDEKADILEKMQTAARNAQRQIETTPLALYNFFIERVRNVLHVCLAFSPIGSAFRTRIRMFPSLVNCCTIDWFKAWPEDALEKVAANFIQPMDLGDFVTHACKEMCQLFHVSVAEASDQMWNDLKRKTYVTPTSYLELIKAFQGLYNEKVQQIIRGRDRYLNGLEKLEFAASQVGVMQEELHALQPQLVVTSKKTDQLMVKIEQDTVVVEKQKEIVGADEALANEAAAAAQAIKDDCESDLAEAIPALNSALEALDTLKPADITIVKSMKNPPAGVRLVMEAVCVIKGLKPDKKPDPSGSGKQIEDYWGASIKMLGDMKFLENLKSFDKDNIPPAAMKRIRDKFIPDRDFEPDVIRNVSTACEGLCRWIRAMDVYDRVIKIVAPKKAALAEAEGELAAQMDVLNQKRAQLQGVMGKLQALNDEFAEFSRKKKDLEDQISLCEQKLDRAEKLIGGLGGEKIRWSCTAAELDASLGNVVGDVLIAAGAVAYLGPFLVGTRITLVRLWNDKCLSLEIPCSQNFSLWDTLGDAAAARAWGLAGLPVDAFSIDNGIIVTHAKRWPLMIDPQGQANKWVKNMEKHNFLRIIKLTDGNYMRVVENSIVLGQPVLLENIGEEIDAALSPVLERSIFVQRGATLLKLGDQVIEYNKNFRFYITTNLRNPHYLPETAVMVTLLNFMITQQGLQDQLLGTVVARERPDLQAKKTQLVIESVQNKDMLQNIEEQILKVLSSEGNILEDETAIKILSSSKILSEEIQAKQVVSAVTEKEIDDARNLYIKVSVHSANLFFCLTELTNIDPMYQYSLTWYLNLFNRTITDAEKSDVLEDRLQNLNDHFTLSIYKNVCRSLFEKHKLTFSFVLCIGILRARGLVEEDLWMFLLTGGVALDNPYPNPAPQWLSDRAWSEIVRSTNLTGLDKYRTAVSSDIEAWREYYNLASPQDNPFPPPMHTAEGLARLVALRCIRPDKVVPAVQQFIEIKMGKVFVEPPVFNLAASYSDSSSFTPLLFILSAGSDPMAGLLKYAADMGISGECFQTISLGQGQGPIAAAMITTGMAEGHWVVLQNCHLAESWMRELERICTEVVVPHAANDTFRLWLTSYPSKAFPVSILQNGVKMTNEAPKGLRLNMLRSYTTDPLSNETFFNSCPLVGPWQRLLFGLVFFHAMIQERRGYGPLGWNIPYEFNESDLRICIMQLQMFLTDYGDVPYIALHYLTGECNYGGRVTDDKDRRLLNSLLDIVYTPATVNIAGYPFSSSGTYHVPKDTSREGCIEYIIDLPLIPHPEVFGLHENADITKNTQETLLLLDAVMATQTQLISGGGGGEGISVADLAADILNRMPKQYNVEAISLKYPVMYSNSMNTVLRQELIRFNRLIAVIRNTLVDVGKAVIGLLALVGNLEEVHNSLIPGKVPSTWASKSYPSLKPLGSYINDLLARFTFLDNWIASGPPEVFWLSGFFFTQSFLTGVLQNYSRGNHLPIDLVCLDFSVTGYESEVPGLPKSGVYIRGLFLEGARWDRNKKALNESFAKILFDTIPIMWLQPGVKKPKTTQVYDCPVYKTSARRGVLSTTGHSTNFVMYTDFASDKPQSHWINRGVASLCQLDD